MSRALSVALTTYLSQPLLALCNCISLSRTDAAGNTVSLGFTSLDQDLVVNGVTYEAFSSADLSDVTQQEGSGVDNLNLIGLLTSNRITEVDIEAGLWDGASVTLFQAPFENLALGTITLLTGYLGNISSDGGQYTAEVRSLSQRLAQQIVELTSNLCRAPELFGPRCMPKGYNENGLVDGTLTRANFQYTAPVVAVGTDGNGFPYIDFGVSVPVGANTRASGVFSYGWVQFLTGLNAGLKLEVKSHTIQAGPVARMILQQPFPFAVAVTDSALLETGCDRRLSTCRLIYKNTYNHQAESFTPGNDSVIARGRK